MHAYHEGLLGYSENQLLHDGCDECEARATESGGGIANLDRQAFARAWARAAEWKRHGMSDLARAEMPMLGMLWLVQVQLEQFGCEIGRVPCA